MVKQRMDLLELLCKRSMDGDVDFLGEALRVLWTASWMPRYLPRSAPSTANAARSGSPTAMATATAPGIPGWAPPSSISMELHISKVREGSYSPSLLEPRRRSEKALLSVIQQAYVEGVSTRRVDDLIKALGCDGISSSQVSRICEQLDEVVESFLGRPLGRWPVSLRVAGRPDPEGPRERSHRQRLRGDGDGGQCRRAA